MLTLVTGGSASGKSEYAESLVLSLPGGQARIYLATMEPFGEEAQERIARHRAMRRGRGFVTMECPRDLEKIRVSSAPMCRARACPRDPEKTLLPSGSSILLEDLGNLVANELFGGPEKERPQGERTDDGALISRILQGIRRLHDACEHLTIVTDEVFSGGQEYAGDTLRYLQVLARVNRELAGRADQVIEVVCGIPVFLRKERNLIDKQNLCDKQNPCDEKKLRWENKDRGERGGSPMLFVTGPSFSGKQEYVMRTFGWDDAAFAANAVRDVQELAAQAVRALPESGMQDRDLLNERLCRLVDSLALEQVVIATEVGGGIVPMDPAERLEREAAGRLACLLAGRARTVVRVNCGLPQILKTKQSAGSACYGSSSD